MTFKGAIFDQDGLLFDTEKTYQRAWIEAAKMQGAEVPESLPKRFCGLSPKLIAETVEREHPELDVPAYCRDAIRLAWDAQLAGVPEPKPGLMQMLDACRARGVRTAIASSSTLRVVRHNIEAAGVADRFDAIVTGDEVERGKPAPDIFLLAAKRIGLAPEECVVFEDAFSGIRGAHAAGCGAVLIPDQTPPDDEIRAICSVFPDLAAAAAQFFPAQ